MSVSSKKLLFLSRSLSHSARCRVPVSSLTTRAGSIAVTTPNARVAALVAALTLATVSPLVLKSRGKGVEVAQCKAAKQSEEVSLVEYEERLKGFDNLDKVFAHYASVTVSGEQHLTRGDFLRAMLAFTYTTLDPPALKRRCANYSNPLLGAGPHHLISRPEFVLLMGLLAVPQAYIRAALAAVDADCSGSIDKKEFLQVSQRLVPLGGEEFDAYINNSHLMKAWFGDDGTGSVARADCEKFLRGLAHDVSSAELRIYGRTSKGDHIDSGKRGWFTWLKRGRGACDSSIETISRKDLALTLVSSYDPSRLKEAVKYLGDLPKPKAQVPLADAMVLHETLSENCDVVVDALAIYSKVAGGRVSYQIFEHAIKLAASTTDSQTPSSDLIRLAFDLFDKKNEGFIDPKELATAMKERRGRSLPNLINAVPPLQRFKDCVMDQ